MDIDQDTTFAGTPKAEQPNGKHSVPRSFLVDLPADVLSHIGTFLSLHDQISFLATHPSILSLAKTHVSPLPSAVSRLLDLGPPYPLLLAKLPSLSIFTPQDDGHLFLDILVRARPRWILERFEYGRWRDDIWKEAFERRFLPSWKRYKGDDDTWRAIFLRTLGRLEHRNLGCTHEESWTRFVTLHRNGSASINRIYSRLFDPYEIYQELKHQNNFSSHPAEVRVVVHLQDIRIIALGVSLSEPSLFINPNAHLLLHPPLLRGFPISDPPASSNHNSSLAEDVMVAQEENPQPILRFAPSTPGLTTHNTEAYFPLVRSLSRNGPASTSYGLSEDPMPPSQSSSSPPASPSLRTSISRVLPGRSKRLSIGHNNPEESTPGSSSLLGGILTTVRSRDRDDEGRRRGWSFSRPRASTGASPPVFARSLPTQSTLLERMNIGQGQESRPGLNGRIDENGSHAGQSKSDEEQTNSERFLLKRSRFPYPRMTKPQPRPSFRDYPNFTDPSTSSFSHTAEICGGSLVIDRRAHHEEIEEADLGSVWSSGDDLWGEGSSRMTEWYSAGGQRRRWAGPMILVAQLHPCDRHSGNPAGTDSSTAIEGDNVDLGSNGMYVSMGFEDLEAIAPWVELKNSGGNSSEPRRSGLGFI